MPQANYSDPNQIGSWLNNALVQAGNVNFMDPASLAQTKGYLTPYFEQQINNLTGNFNRQYGQQSSQAGMNAGALAAQKGINPQAFMQSAQRGVREQMNPGYFSNYNQMLESQLGNLLNTTMQGNQFEYNKYMDKAKTFGGMYGQALEYEGRPRWYDYALGGLMQAGGAVGAAAI
jgi:hypothetical protein